MKRLALLGVFFLALLALGAASTIAVVDTGARWMKSGFYVGSTAGKTSTNRISNVLNGSVLVDFDGGTLGCTDIAVGVAGVLQGDRCDLGPTVSETANNAFFCFPSDAGEVTVRNCHLGVASDPASATYGFTIFSVQ